MAISNEAINKRRAQKIFEEHGQKTAFVPFVKLAVRMTELIREMEKELGLPVDKVAELVVSSALTHLKMVNDGQLSIQYELNVEIEKLIDAEAHRKAVAAFEAAKAGE